MKYFFALLVLLLPAVSQAEELYSDSPHCANIKNDTKVMEFVAIRTDFYTKPDGKRSYYEEVLHLKPGAVQQVCAKGPFFPDYKVTLKVKSFFPLFECQTRLQGEIAVHDKALPDGEGRKVWADCVN